MVIHEITHIVLSLIVGLIAYFWLYRKKYIIIVGLITGLFLDIDHLYDYFSYEKSFKISLSQILQGNYFDASGKVYVLLHSYELALVLLLLALFFRKRQTFKVIMFVLGLSLILHLLYDTFYYRPIWETYFLTYRTLHHFNINDFKFKR